VEPGCKLKETRLLSSRECPHKRRSALSEFYRVTRRGLGVRGGVMAAVIRLVQVTSHWTVTVTDRVVRPYWLVAYSL
jgi:hypothetical protein